MEGLSLEKFTEKMKSLAAKRVAKAKYQVGTKHKTKTGIEFEVIEYHGRRVTIQHEDGVIDNVSTANLRTNEYTGLKTRKKHFAELGIEDPLLPSGWKVENRKRAIRKWYEGQKVVVTDDEWYIIKEIKDLTTVTVEWHDGFVDTFSYKSLSAGIYTGKNSRKRKVIKEDLKYQVGNSYYVHNAGMSFTVTGVDGLSLDICWETGESYTVLREYLYRRMFTVKKSKYFPKEDFNDSLIVCDNYHTKLSFNNTTRYSNVIGIRDIYYTKDKLSFSLLRDAMTDKESFGVDESVWSWIDYEVTTSFNTGVDVYDLAILHATCLMIESNHQYNTVVTFTDNMLDFGIEYGLMDDNCPASTTFRKNIGKIKEFYSSNMGKECDTLKENFSVSEKLGMM